MQSKLLLARLTAARPALTRLAWAWLTVVRPAWARAAGRGRLAWPPAWLAVERDRLVLWLPVLMGVGVLTYFALRREPPPWIGLALLVPAALGAALGAGLARPGASGSAAMGSDAAAPSALLRGALVAVTAFAAGLTAAQVATWRAAPLIVLPTHAVTISGVVRQIDPLPVGRRLLLEAVRLEAPAPEVEAQATEDRTATRTRAVRKREAQTGTTQTGTTQTGTPQTATPEPATPQSGTPPKQAARISATLPGAMPAGAALMQTGQTLDRMVRVRLRRGDPIVVATGDRVRVRALLRVPASPAYPGGWDLQRDAFYAGLGGSGFALGPAALVAAANPSGPARRVQRLREAIGARFMTGMPGAAGTIAATLFTGMSGAIPPADHAAFRDSGLAHLLAVAGLHIGIVMGWTMLLTRAALALCEFTALRWSTKQIGAFVALAVGGGYMVLTGMHVPIMRSFAMAALYTVAVLWGRRAISLRGLGLAGVVLMLTAPQEVPGVSFQMSFAAVLALIAGYEVLRPRLAALRGEGGWRGKLTLHLAMLGLTSLLAGTASMPFGAYHFGRIQVYFVVSNMVAVPLTAFWVMPLGLVALALMPLGLDRLVMLPMSWGVEAILWVARTTAALPAATLPVAHAPAWGLALVGLGMAWLGLWRGRVRLAGIAMLAVGLASPLLARPADLLVSADGRLIAVHTASGVFVEQGAGASRFIRDDWTDYWGDGAMTPMPKSGTAAAGAIACDAVGCLLRPRPGAAAALLVRGQVSVADCRAAAVEVAAEPARGRCPRPWPKLVDRFTVWRYGSVAIWLRPAGAVIVSDRWKRGTRPWVAPLPERHAAKPDPRLPMAPREPMAARD